MELVERYKELKEKKESLDRKLAGEESAFKTLKEQYDAKLKELKEKYGVSTLQEAQALLDKEEAELSEIVAKGEELLANVDISLI